MSVFLPAILYTVYQVLEVGLMDGLEYRYVNKGIFLVHNFPDILRVRKDEIKSMRYPFMSAVLSGFICCIPLLLPLIIKLVLLFIYKNKIDRSRLVKLLILISIAYTISDLIALATYDPSKLHTIGYLYLARNHDWFYGAHILSEVISILSIILCIRK